MVPNEAVASMASLRFTGLIDIDDTPRAANIATLVAASGDQGGQSSDQARRRARPHQVYRTHREAQPAKVRVVVSKRGAPGAHEQDPRPRPGPRVQPARCEPPDGPDGGDGLRERFLPGREPGAHHGCRGVTKAAAAEP